MYLITLSFWVRYAKNTNSVTSRQQQHNNHHPPAPQQNDVVPLFQHCLSPHHAVSHQQFYIHNIQPHQKVQHMHWQTRHWSNQLNPPPSHHTHTLTFHTTVFINMCSAAFTYIFVQHSNRPWSRPGCHVTTAISSCSSLDLMSYICTTAFIFIHFSQLTRCFHMWTVCLATSRHGLMIIRISVWLHLIGTNVMNIYSSSYPPFHTRLLMCWSHDRYHLVTFYLLIFPMVPS